MKTTSDYVKAGFQKMDQDLSFMVGCLAETLAEIGENDAAACLPWLHPQPTHQNAQISEQALSIAFQLLNIVEENASTNTRRMREVEGRIHEEPGTWAQVLNDLKKAGFSPQQIAKILPEIKIEPVLTAHPTEAKRNSVLEQHRKLFSLLAARENPVLTPSQKDSIRSEIKSTLEILWRSGEILLQKPDVASERNSTLFYLKNVFPLAVDALDERLRYAWPQAGFPPALLDDPSTWPKVRFASWVGGDRDGHPLVTAEVTRQTFAEMRECALHVLHQKLQDLAQSLPLSSHFQKPSPKLSQALARLGESQPIAQLEISRQYPDEPWRQLVLLMQQRLPIQTSIKQNPPEAFYQSPEELDSDLALLADILQEAGAGRLAAKIVWPVRRALDVFGFHLAALDIRQNSQFHDIAFSQILAASGFKDCDFANWNESRRLEFLNQELLSPRPFLYSDEGIGPEADALLACFSVLRREIREHGHGAIGSLIVSMTRQLSDLLVVYLFAREAGLMKWTNDGLACAIPVVPLFETLSDLNHSPQLLADFLSHPVTKRSLALQQNLGRQILCHPNSHPTQQVMIGYSDSNKDSGALASQYALHQAQQAMAQVGRKAGTRIRFFHGRGGTISRGAGPTDRFLAALPMGSLDGDIRLTEQGETIAQKYSNLVTATYNLELLLAGVTRVSLVGRQPTPDPIPNETWEILAQKSNKKYSSLITHPNFMAFYSHATPIDALETSSIGSRPARRTGQRTLKDLRAIPWVFSWNQSRYYLPGWFGAGTALQFLKSTHPHLLETLQSKLRQSPFSYYVFTNVETNLASADPSIMQDYASLVPDNTCRDEILQIILAEFNLARQLLSELFGSPFATRRPRMARTLQQRAAPLQTLHQKQISLLRQWRAARSDSPHEAARLLPHVILSINAIASGLRTTG